MTKQITFFEHIHAKVRAKNAPPKNDMPTNHLAYILATWFWSGRSPLMAGTAGSLAALPFAWFFLTYMGSLGLFLNIIFVTYLGLKSAEWYEKHSGTHDASPIVIDEVVGMWIALLFLPTTGENWAVWWIVAFVFFRIFDWTKPWPASFFEKKRGAVGVMFDDIAAGVYALILTQLTYHYWG